MSLVALVGGTLASAASHSDSDTPVALVAAPYPAPRLAPSDQPLTPTADPAPCDPAQPPRHCAPTSITPPISSTLPVPCSGEGCIPQPGPPTTTPPTDPGTGQPGQGDQPSDDCGITDIGACITEAINAFFRGIVTEALNPLLDLLSKTLLTTPTPDSLPRVGELWNNSWQILLVSYSLLVVIAGVIAMGYQTVHTRHSIKDLAPRLVVGFLAGALSLWVATKGIQIANALVAAIMGGGVDANSAGQTLRNLVLGAFTGAIWILFIGIVLAGMLIALLITYVVRVALTIILIAGAPLALMFHALPQTEGIAHWWWRAYGGCLAIQLGQSLTLITAIKVFLAPGGFTLFGPTMSGLINLLVALALTYILFKIPSWVLSSVRGGGGRTGLIGSLVKGFLAYKTYGLLGGRGSGRGGGPSGGHDGGHRGGPSPNPLSGGRGGGGGSGGSSFGPYASPRATANGQYVLPLGVRRTRPTGKPALKSGPTPTPVGSRGRQLALPLGEDWPENRPRVGRDGQYRLPLHVRHTTLPPAPSVGMSTGSDAGGRRTRTGGGRQLELPLDPYRGNRPTRSGQYPLPLDGVRRVPRPTTPPPPRPGRRQTIQPELPFDPYKGNRAGRGGQYPLPLDGVRRGPAPKPAPAPPPRPAPRAGQQLRLPLDLPKPPKPPAQPSPKPRR